MQGLCPNDAPLRPGRASREEPARGMFRAVTARPLARQDSTPPSPSSRPETAIPRAFFVFRPPLRTAGGTKAAPPIPGGYAAATRPPAAPGKAPAPTGWLP